MVDSYCTRCGVWLPDLDARAGRGIFRKQSREERIRKVRVLEAVSAGLSLTAVAIIIGFIRTGRNGEMLALAAVCTFLVAVYQVVNIYLGYKIQHRIDRSRTDNMTQMSPPAEPRELHSANPGQFAPPPSIVENTTDLLDPIPRQARRDR